MLDASFVVNASTYPRPSRLPSLISDTLSTLGSDASPLTHTLPSLTHSPPSPVVYRPSPSSWDERPSSGYTRTLKRGGPWSLFASCLAPDNPTIIINATVLTDCSCSPVDSRYSRPVYTLRRQFEFWAHGCQIYRPGLQIMHLVCVCVCFDRDMIVSLQCIMQSRVR